MLRVPVSPQVLRWAVARSGKDEQDLAGRFPRLLEWMSGETQPTWRQAQDFAQATYTPVGYLFLSDPPEETVPIADMRTIADKGVTRPSPNLLETIYLCQQRQGWYQDYAQLNNLDPVELVGSTRPSSGENIEATADRLRTHLGFSLKQRYSARTFLDALVGLVRQLDVAGIMVMTSGIVGSNTHRPLDPQEFRGFALADPHAPVVFVNGNSSKSAQMFTLAHELGHIVLGETALSDADAGTVAREGVERWCNRFAAEFLVPMADFRQLLVREEPVSLAIRRLGRLFKVSTLVALRRLYEAGELEREQFWQEYQDEVARLANLELSGGGGNFYGTQRARVSERFMRAVIVDTLEGQTLYRDALKLLGTRKVSTLQEMGRRLGIES